MELCIHSYKKSYVHLVLQIKNSAFSITSEIFNQYRVL